ncbi:MAG: hypothetical protein V1706_15840 [Pseudomonadota bacterium]
MNKNLIINSIDSPSTLEKLYRNNRKQFRVWLNEALNEYPESDILKVWSVRLNYVQPISDQKKKVPILIIVVLSLISGILVKLPNFFPIMENWYYPRFVPLVILTALIFYFLGTATKSIQVRIKVLTGVTLCAFVLFLLPHDLKSASIIMSQIHIPMVLISLLAFSFMGEKWMDQDARLLFVRYIGEIFIYGTILLLGGIVLTFLTFGLFGLIGLSIENWYMSYIVVFGLVASPIVSTYIYDSVLGRDSKLATLIANVFSPLFLITVISYLLAILHQGKSPYTDRNFLIMFNGLLIIVLAITIFSISGRSNSKTSKLFDTINTLLVSTTLIINIIALSAILFRLTEYGITPNRISVTGANILIFVHLVLILKEYINQLRTTYNQESLNRIVAGYLPVYSTWSVFIAVGLPLLFKFQKEKKGTDLFF